MQRSLDLLGYSNIENPDTPLHAMLIGFRESVKRKLGMKKFSLVIHNDHKGATKALHGSDSLPYGYFRFPQISVNTERFNNRTLGRVAASHSWDDMLNGTVSKEFILPISCNISCFYRTNQIEDVTKFIQNLLFMSQFKKLDFVIGIPNMEPWTVHITLEGDVSIPEVEIDNEEMPLLFELPFTFKVETFISLVKDVPKINNLGAVTTNLNVDGQEVP